MTDVHVNLEALPPAEMLVKAGSIGEKKAALPLANLLPLSFLAGTYIAFGAVFASVVAIGMAGNWPYGFMKLLQGLVFSLGLILVVVGGGELFTGNILLVVAWAQKKISLLRLIYNWLIVYFGNFIGSITIVFFYSGKQGVFNFQGSLGIINAHDCEHQSAIWVRPGFSIGDFVQYHGLSGGLADLQRTFNNRQDSRDNLSNHLFYCSGI